MNSWTKCAHTHTDTNLLHMFNGSDAWGCNMNLNVCKEKKYEVAQKTLPQMLSKWDVFWKSFSETPISSEIWQYKIKGMAYLSAKYLIIRHAS
jgi:hypothetical protein